MVRNLPLLYLAKLLRTSECLEGQHGCVALGERIGKFTDSWQNISQPYDREDYTKRWDWHAWQLFVALLPAAGLANLINPLFSAHHKPQVYIHKPMGLMP